MNHGSPFSRIFFIGSILLISLAIFSLILWRVSAIFGFHYSWKKILLGAGIFVLIFMAGMLLHNAHGKAAELFGTAVVRLIYLLWFITPIILLVDLVNLFYKVPPIAIAITMGLRVLGGLYFALWPKQTKLEITSNKVSREYRVVFISDLHVTRMFHESYIQSLVNRIQKIKPDAVLIGGDLMDTSKLEYAPAFHPFNDIEVPVFATLGNHDHMGDEAASKNIFTTTKIDGLRNESKLVQELQIVGIDDKSYRDGKTVDDVLRESSMVNSGEYTILITHQPINLSKIKDYPIDLELAGHTHRGQFIPLSWLIGLFNEYAYGLYKQDSRLAFVSQGVGLRGAPLRMGTQSEIVVITIKPEK